MSRIPTEFTPYNISDVVATPKEGEFRAYGSDLSEVAGNVIYFYSIPLGRTVAFKAFIESIKLSIKKEADKVKKDDQNFTVVKEKTSTMSYDLSINIPAHSVNESRNNLAKLEELQRLILPPFSKSFETTIQNKDGSSNLYRSTVGVDTRDFGMFDDPVMLPIFTVLFKNLINSGIPGAGVKNYDDLRKKGFPCYIESIKYDPDQEAGYFEFDNYLYPKNIKLSVTLNYDSEAIANLTLNKAIRPYSIRGHLYPNDTGLFPFHSEIGIKQMNEIFSDGERIDSYIFIANMVDLSELSLFRSDFFDKGRIANKTKGAKFTEYYGDKKTTGTSILDETDEDNAKRYNFIPRKMNTSMNQAVSPTNRLVLFKPFIESFSRTQGTKIITEDAADFGIYKRVLKNGVAIGSLEYDISFNLLAKDVEEAQKNAAKIQTLCRLCLRKELDGSEDVGLLSSEFPSRENLSKSNKIKNVMVYIPSMIERPNSGQEFTTDPVEMFERSIDLYLSDFSFEIDSDFGFFDEGEMLFAKAYKVTLKFEDTDMKYLREYQMLDSDPSNENVRVVAPRQERRKENNHLFPYNRKTVTIGGR